MASTAGRRQAAQWWRAGLGVTLAVWGLGFAGAPAEAQPPVVPAHLVQRAATAGSVRVIVQISAPAIPEATLPGDVAVATQRHAIATAQSAVLSRLAGVRHRALRQYVTFPFLAIEGGPDALTVLESLRGLVVSVEEDALHRPTLAQSGPLVQAPTAWEAGYSGAGQVIAVLDTGVDTAHPFLAGKVVEQACFSAGQDGTAGAGDCPNGLSTQIGPGSGVPCTYAPSACQHGTHVAGIAAGLGGASGVARGAQIMAVRVFSRFTGSACANAGENPCTGAWTSDILAGLERVLAIRGTRSFAAVNLSLGGEAFTAVCDAAYPATTHAINQLRAAGIATVVASGNDGYPNELSNPACISTAISVGSITDGGPGATPADRVSSFSNSAFFLSLLAPGQFVTSSVPGGGFAQFQGTSMAAPHVAGAWAILKAAQPAASVTQILSILQSTGLPIVDARNGIPKPRIRVFNALIAVLPPPNACSSTPTNFEGGDYDGDGQADVGLYRTSTGEWLIRRSTDAGLTLVAWGAPVLSDVPVPGDYDGDGTTDITVYRRSTGGWYIRRSTDLGLTEILWGAPVLSDVPVPGDYDGDGTMDIAVYRQSTGEWLIRRSTDAGLTLVAWGAPVLSDVPVPGDYDGDGTTDIAVYRRSTGGWYIRRSTDLGLTEILWGAPALDDVPVPGNYTEAGVAPRTDVAVYRRSTGVWYIRRATDAGLTLIPWGAPGLKDVPAQGDYDGDGKTDAGVYRASTGEWLLRRSINAALVHVAWGAPVLSDIPPTCR